MIQVTHLLVLSQPEFLERQVCGVLASQCEQAPSRRRFGRWWR
jgi:hypothetical protein